MAEKIDDDLKLLIMDYCFYIFDWDIKQVIAHSHTCSYKIMLWCINKFKSESKEYTEMILFTTFYRAIKHGNLTIPEMRLLYSDCLSYPCAGLELVFIEVCKENKIYPATVQWMIPAFCRRDSSMLEECMRNENAIIKMQGPYVYNCIIKEFRCFLDAA